MGEPISEPKTVEELRAMPFEEWLDWCAENDIDPDEAMGNYVDES